MKKHSNKEVIVKIPRELRLPIEKLAAAGGLSFDTVLNVFLGCGIATAHSIATANDEYFQKLREAYFTDADLNRLLFNMVQYFDKEQKFDAPNFYTDLKM